MLGAMIIGFWEGLTHGCPSHKKCIHDDKELHQNLSEEQIDHMLEESFPASDPPATY